MDRIIHGTTPEEFLPTDLVCSPEELEEADHAVRGTPIPKAVRTVVGFMLGQLDFCRRASNRLEYCTKDTLHLAGRRVGQVCTEDCPLDKNENLCTQTENGVSPRAVQSLLHLAQALAWFRGRKAVGVEDVRALLPWVLHDKLQPNPQSAFFHKPENQVYLTDRVSWILQLFDRAVAQHAAYAPGRGLTAELERTAEGMRGLTTIELRSQRDRLRTRLEQVERDHELNGAVYMDLIMLKDLYVRCQNELERRQAGVL
jgi:hypothetical protein